MEDETFHESTSTYPAKVITVDWTPISVGVLGLVLLIILAVLLWRGRKRRHPSEK
jgi:hypothetical protein